MASRETRSHRRPPDAPHRPVSPAIVGAAPARLRVRLGGVVVLALAGLAVAVLVGALGSHGQSTTIPGGQATTVGAEEPGEEVTPGGAGGAEGTAAAIYVHLLGAVARPGLYELRDGARAVDAVAAAGGFTADADRTQLNLARFVSDGEQIVVPVVGAAPVAAPGAPGTTGPGSVGGKVNINTADATALETLPRVGPAMAARIIDWRETNGRFASVDDLRAVTGIGEKTFAALRDLVTV